MSVVTRTGWLVVVAACGGSVFNEGDGGTATDGGKPANDGGGGPVCPPSPATSGSACSPPGIECEYGSDPNPSCNTVMSCGGAHWMASFTGTCPGPGPMCPATYASVPANQDCTADNLMCSYPEGVCICTHTFGPPRMTPGWACFPTKPGCPTPRPILGSTCSQPGLDCNYGYCAGGVDEVCIGGYWHTQSTPCPN